MPVPLLIPLVAVGASGVAAGAKGLNDMQKARKSMKRSEAKHADAVRHFEKKRSATQKRLETYGAQQLRVQVETLGSFVVWLEENERNVKKIDRSIIDGVEVTIARLPAMKSQVVKAEKLLAGGLTAVATGTAARTAAMAGVQAWASAGTGTAISSLSGAAAQNAALAYLGGGTVASGGGGMAAGATVLSGVAIAPGLLIAGVTVGIQGHKAKTRAAKMRATVNTSIAHLESSEAALAGIVTRADELSAVLERLDERARTSLGRLRGVAFDPSDHAELFFAAAKLIGSVSEVLNAPVLDADGELTDESILIVERYTEL